MRSLFSFLAYLEGSSLQLQFAETFGLSQFNYLMNALLASLFGSLISDKCEKRGRSISLFFLLITASYFVICFKFKFISCRDAIATWMRQKSGLVVQTVSTTEEAKRILRTNYVIVMGFLDTLEVFSPCWIIFSFPSNE